MARRHSLLDINFFADGADDPLASRRRSLLLQSAIAILTGIVVLGVGLWLLVTGLDILLGGAFVATALVRAATVILAWRDRGNAYLVLVHIVTAGLLYCVAIVDIGAHAGIEIWAVPLVALPIITMGPQQRRLLPLISATTIGAVVAGAILARWFPPYRALTPEILSRLQLVNLVMVAAFTAMVLRVYRRMLDRAETRIVQEQEVSERLLANILPGPIATRLKRDEHPIADGFACVTVLFADVVGFTEFSAHATPETVVNLLNCLFHAFDDMVERRGLEKIKTIGDAYMVAAGVPDHREDHAAVIAEFAFEMLAFTASLPPEQGRAVALRIGVHSGPLVAGVIGKRKFSYDVWGDTVNTAARLEAASEPGRIQISAETARLLGPAWRVEPRGALALKGLGEVPCFFLLGRAQGAAPRPTPS